MGADPDLLANSPTRRARVARESEKTEKEVAEMIAAFAQMRQQMRQLMQGGIPGELKKCMQVLGCCATQGGQGDLYVLGGRCDSWHD